MAWAVVYYNNVWAFGDASDKIVIGYQSHAFFI